MPGPSLDESARLTADLAIERGLVTRAQVDEALEVMAKLAGMGVPEELGRILVKKGLISDAQLRELEARAQPKQPANVGGFEILARLGRGSMGTVYKARQVSMDRVVALKVLPPALAKDKTFIERFFREARAVAKLNHPNIVQGIDVGSADKYYYFAMEYVEGETVQNLIVRDGPMPERKALEIILQVAHALHHAHRHGMVHRDIKPDNIIVTPASVAKLCDLGLAKTLSGDSSVTQTGLAVGTPHYISPEQARGDQDVDIRSDLYSLGATLYHMLLGRTPFSGSSAAVVMTKHLNEELADPRTIRPELSAGLAALIHKMMAKDRTDRYQTPEAVISDINLVLSGRLPAGARATPALAAHDRAVAAPARPRPVSRRTTAQPAEAVPPRRKSRTLLYAGAGLLLLVAVGATLGVVLGSQNQNSNTGNGGNLPPPPPIGNGDKPKPEDEEAHKRLKALAEAFNAATAYARQNPRDLTGIVRRFEKLAGEAKGTIYEQQARYEADRAAAELKRQGDDVVAEIKAKAEALEKQEKFGEAAKLYDQAPIQVMLRERQRIEALAQSRYDLLKTEAQRIFQAGKYDEKNAGSYDEAAKCLQKASGFGLPKVDERLATDLAAFKSEHEARLADRNKRLSDAEAERLRQLGEKFAQKRKEVFEAAAKMELDAETGRYRLLPAAKLAKDSLLTPEFKTFEVEAQRIERDLKVLDAFFVGLPETLQPRLGQNVEVSSFGRGRERGVLDEIKPGGIYLRPEGVPGAALIRFAKIAPASLAELAGLSASAPADAYKTGVLAFYSGRAAEAVAPMDVAAKNDKLKVDAEYYLGLARAAYRQRYEEQAATKLRECREKFAQYQAAKVPKGDPRWAALRDELEQLLKDYADTDAVRQNRGDAPEKK